MQDVVLYVLALLAVVGLVAGYAYPTTRPYIKKYGWILVGFATLLIAYTLLRRRPGRSSTKEGAELIKGESLNALDKIMETAEEQALLADTELAKKQLATETARVEYQAKVEAVNSIDSSVERRKALIKLVGGTK